MNLEEECPCSDSSEQVNDNSVSASTSSAPKTTDESCNQTITEGIDRTYFIHKLKMEF